MFCQLRKLWYTWHRAFSAEISGQKVWNTKKRVSVGIGTPDHGSRGQQFSSGMAGGITDHQRPRSQTVLR